MGANIAEGYGRFGKSKIEEIIAKNEESIKMLASSLKTLRAKN